jgi:hypothetical protein
VVVDGKKERKKGGGQCRRKRWKICGIHVIVILYTRVVWLFCLFKIFRLARGIKYNL